MNNIDLITSREEYWGEVVDVDDPIKAGRVRVRVETIFNDIPVEYIPWATPRYVDSASYERPYLGETVQVKFVHNDHMTPQWYRIRLSDLSILDNDYDSYTVIKQKDLSNYGLDGKIDVSYRESEGLKVALERGGNNSEFIIRNDNSIFMKNANTGRIIHISNESLSLGSETKSQQPSVVGDDNQKALEMINDTIKKLKDSMVKNLKVLENLADASPYTKHLKIGFKLYHTEIEQLVNQLHQENHTFFPETKSTISTIDKT